VGAEFNYSNFEKIYLVCSTKAQTLSPGTSRSAHIESRSAQVFALEPFLKDKYQEVMDYPNVHDVSLML